MALFALQSQLALVNVSVAVRAFSAHIGEDQTDVALTACNPLVHRPQRVSSFVVIELKDVAKRFPRRQSMAILTRNRQSAVGTARHTSRA